MAKCFVSSQSEHGWRAPFNGLSRNGWNVLGRTFLVQNTEKYGSKIRPKIVNVG
jgi:hypothetical protein